MAYVNLVGGGFPYPYFSSLLPSTPTSGIPALASSLTDAAGEITAYIGHVHFTAGEGTSKTVSSAGGKLQFRTGAVTWAGAGTTLIVGLQDVSSTTGPVVQPDEVWTGEPQKSLVQGTDALSANTWTTATFSSGSRTIAHGDLIAVVFDMTVRNGADAVNVTGLQAPAAQHRPTVVNKTGGTYAALTMFPNVIIECDDGTLATIKHSYPCSAVTTRSFNTGSTPDEYGNIIIPPFDCKTDALWSNVAPGAALELNLYSSAGGTPVQEQQNTIDENQVIATSGRGIQASITQETLDAGSTYAVTVRPTTGTNVTAYEISVNTASHMAFWPGGTSVYKCTRSDDTGAFATDTASRLLMGIQVSAIDDGTGAGASGGSFTFLG